MTDKKQQIPEGKKPPLPFTTPLEDLPEHYANFVNVNWTSYDVRLRFGQALPHEDHETGEYKWVIRGKVAVSLAWAEAKFLHSMLGEVIERYEAVNGELKTPTSPGAPSS